MGAALAVHDRLLRAAIESRGGAVIKTTGDGITDAAAVDSAWAAGRALSMSDAVALAVGG